jgi:hypothetical protein
MNRSKKNSCNPASPHHISYPNLKKRQVCVTCRLIDSAELFFGLLGQQFFRLQGLNAVVYLAGQPLQFLQ